MHPFSIESLTSPEVRPHPVPRSVALSLTMPAMVPPLTHMVSVPLSPISPGMDGTGSTDCSPNTSFDGQGEDMAAVVDHQVAAQAAQPPSPAHSEDSGRGTPQLAEESADKPAPQPGKSSTTNSNKADNKDSKGDSEKPPHSYIALISMAILSIPDKKMVLSDIYQYIMDHYGFYSNEDRAWRNSIRHNLSLNECFIKAGRAENGKGNYWAIHPACVEDFSKGDFRRRQARRRARSTVLEPALAALPLAYRYGLGTGYVPMTSAALSSLGYHPYLHPPLPYLQNGFYPSPLGSPTPFPGFPLSPPAITSPTCTTVSQTTFSPRSSSPSVATSTVPSPTILSQASSSRNIRYSPYSIPHHPVWQREPKDFYI